MSLRTRLTAAFVLVLLVPLLVAAVVVGVVVPRASVETQQRGLTSSARLAAAAVHEVCGRVRAAAEAAARAAGDPADQVVRTAAQALVDRGLVDGVRVVDARSVDRAVAGTPPTPGGGDCTTGAALTAGDGVALAATTGVRRDGGAVVGSVTAGVTVDAAFARRLRESAGAGDVVLLVEGVPVAASGPVDEAVVRAAVRGAPDAVVADDRVAVLAAAQRQQPVGVLLVQDRPPGRRGALWLLLLVGGGALALASVIAAGLARATTGPLAELGRAVDRIAEGDLSATIAVRSGDEVDRLAAAFNAMTDRLRAQVQELEDRREQLRAGVDRLGQALSGTHDLQRILTVVLDTAIASTGSRGGAVLLLDRATRTLVHSVGRNLEAHGVSPTLRVPLGAGVSGGASQTGLPVRGASGADPDDVRTAPGEPVGVPLVAVPLKSSTSDVGVLLLWDPASPAGYTDSDVETLCTFTSQASVAVDNVLLHDEARRLSLTDGLTGLWNYRYFTMTIGKEIDRAARFGRPLSLLLLDLDHFKLVNDVFGHPRGDAVLVELASRLRGQVRDVDLLARYGGEEFVVVLPETDRDGAVHAAERIGAAVRRRPFGEGEEQPVDVTLSMGIAVYPDHGTTASTLLRRADEALYAAKRGGRDTWRLATADPTPEAAHGPSSRADVGSPPWTAPQKDLRPGPP